MNPADPADPKPLARTLAMRRLTVRDYAACELMEYLKRKGVSSQLAEEAVDRLVAEGLVDDSRYARIVARQLAQRGKGPRYIRNKLKEKGVRLDAAEISRILNDVNPVSELESARQILDRRYPEYSVDEKSRSRAFQALLRRGFSDEVARMAVFGKSGN